MASVTAAFTPQIAPSIAPPLVVTGGSITLIEGTNTTGFDLEDPGTLSPSNGLVQKDQSLTVNVQWTISGLLAPFLSAQYTCTAYLEMMGVNEVAADFSASTPHVMAASNLYNVNIPITTSSLATGIYHLVVSLTTKDTGSSIGFPLVGFVDLGCIQIYES